MEALTANVHDLLQMPDLLLVATGSDCFEKSKRCFRLLLTKTDAIVVDCQKSKEDAQIKEFSLLVLATTSVIAVVFAFLR